MEHFGILMKDTSGRQNNLLMCAVFNWRMPVFVRKRWCWIENIVVLLVFHRENWCFVGKYWCFNGEYCVGQRVLVFRR